MIFGDIDELLAVAETAEMRTPEEEAMEAERLKLEAAARLESQKREVARQDAIDALRREAADKRGRELAAERAAVNEIVRDALAPFRRPTPAEPSTDRIGTMRRWLDALRAEPADKKSPCEDDLADGTFPAPGGPDTPAPRTGPTTHYVSAEREELFFKELRRRSTGGHPFRDARDPLTGKSASVLLNTPLPRDEIPAPPADRKSPPPPFKTCPPWRDLSPRARATYGIEAARSGGKARAITIGLGDLVKAKAPHAKHGALRFVMKRIDKGLKAAFDDAPPLFVTLEDKGGEDEIGLHLHGVIELSEHQIGKVCEVIRGVVGAWREHVDKQVKIEPIYSRGWATYITEDNPLMRAATGRRGYYMNHDLRRRAEETHRRDVDFINITGGLIPKASQN